MKKLFLIAMLVLGLGLFAGCQQATPPAAEAQAVSDSDIPVDLEIRDKMFIAQTEDVYVNLDDYIGKNVKYEGMFFSYFIDSLNRDYHTVVRYGPGCCGDDGQVGFEVAWADGQFETPAINDWVEIIGTVDKYEEMGGTFLRLNVQSMNVLSERGLETVTQ